MTKYQYYMSKADEEITKMRYLVNTKILQV